MVPFDELTGDIGLSRKGPRISEFWLDGSYRWCASYSNA